MDTMTDQMLIGASLPSGVKYLEMFRKIRLGNCVLTPLPVEESEALAVARYCKEHRIMLFFSELLHRGTTTIGKFARTKIPRGEFYSKEELEEIFDAAGEFYGGRMTIGEAGGILYWPKAYVIGRRAREWRNPPPAQTMAEAKDAYIRYVRQFLDFERSELGRGPLLNVDSSIAFKYHAEAGIDVLCLESMPGDPHLTHAAIRGAARAYGKPWGTHIAMQCYGGMCFDELYEKRWRTALFHAYLSGAEFIWPESGHFTYANAARNQAFSFDSPPMKRIRGTLRQVYQFSQVHQRPAGGPRVAIGVVHGNLDGAPGLWNPYVWGQFRGRKWREGAPEKGWELVHKFHRKEDWPSEKVQGAVDFSGNPPYGQYDVVPAEAALDILKKYACLLFLGWNTMTPETYGKLKDYVEAGGHLVMYLPHLSTHTDRAKDLRLLRNGDFRDLFGVKVLGKAKTDVMGIKCGADSSLPGYRFPLWRLRTDPRFLGEMTPARVKVTSARIISVFDDFYWTPLEEQMRRPAVVENTLGKGKAFLVTAWQYPGDAGIRRFSEDLIRVVLGGEQGDIRLLASDRVRYAVYDGKAPGARRSCSTVYLLNTDPDCASRARLWVRGKQTQAFDLAANDLRLAYVLGPLVVVPSDRLVDLNAWHVTRSGHEIQLFSVSAQKVEIHNLAAKPISVSLNGTAVACGPGECKTVRIRRAVDPSRRDFFARDFLEEPRVEFGRARLAY